jgi:2',3'-cyclic-nucleotide 2'-phosphodiesterase (5'-nucleotidase family)
VRYFLFFSILFFSACFSHKPLPAPSYHAGKTSIAIAQNISDSSAKKFSMLDAYRKELDATMNVIVGSCDAELNKEKPNGSLGSMVCDAMLHCAKKIDTSVCLAIANYGGIRISALQKGNITRGKIYELMPFENTIAIMQLSGVQIDSFCQKIAKAGGMPISGLSFSMKNNKATAIYIAGKALQADKLYSIALNSYMANGGDECEFLIPLKKNITSVLIRDAIFDYISFCNSNNISLYNTTDRIK